MIYRAGSYETDDKFRMVEYKTFDDFRTGTVFKTLSGEVLRLTEGHRPLIIPYPSSKSLDPDVIRKRIAEAKGRFPHLGMDVAAIEKAWEHAPTTETKPSESDRATPPAPATPAAVTAPLVLKSGEVFQGWSVSRVDGDTVRILHVGGVVAVALTNIPSSMLETDPNLASAIAATKRAAQEKTAHNAQLIGEIEQLKREEASISQSLADRGFGDSDIAIRDFFLARKLPRLGFEYAYSLGPHVFQATTYGDELCVLVSRTVVSLSNRRVELPVASLGDMDMNMANGVVERVPTFVEIEESEKHCLDLNNKLQLLRKKIRAKEGELEQLKGTSKSRSVVKKLDWDDAKSSAGPPITPPPPAPGMKRDN